jgi:hypothetical protein
MHFTDPQPVHGVRYTAPDDLESAHDPELHSWFPRVIRDFSSWFMAHVRLFDVAHNRVQHYHTGSSGHNQEVAVHSKYGYGAACAEVTIQFKSGCIARAFAFRRLAVGCLSPASSDATDSEPAIHSFGADARTTTPD